MVIGEHGSSAAAASRVELEAERRQDFVTVHQPNMAVCFVCCQVATDNGIRERQQRKLVPTPLAQVTKIRRQ